MGLIAKFLEETVDELFAIDDIELVSTRNYPSLKENMFYG